MQIQGSIYNYFNPGTTLFGLTVLKATLFVILFIYLFFLILVVLGTLCAGIACFTFSWYIQTENRTSANSPPTYVNTSIIIGILFCGPLPLMS